jgi:hypothetical protein
MKIKTTKGYAMEGLLFILFIIIVSRIYIIYNEESTIEKKPIKSSIFITSKELEALKISKPIVTPAPFTKIKWVEATYQHPIDYIAYIKSSAWQLSKARIATLHLDNFSCRMCGSNEELQVHHITYVHLGNETTDCLVTLCKECHNETHRVAGKGARYYPPIKRKIL